MILVFAPSPITQAVPAILLKWLEKAHRVLWIQDLWPESLAATGFVKNRRGLENLVLTGRFPADVTPDIFAKASALLVSLNDEEIFSHTIPSKVQACLVAGRRIIACLNGEGVRVVQQLGSGLSSPAEQCCRWWRLSARCAA